MHVVVGTTRIRRERALEALGFASIDPFGRPDVLVLTDTHRARERVGHSALAAGTFEPRAQVVGAWFNELWRRFGDGRAVLGPRALGLLAEPLVDRSPTLAALGPSSRTGLALARHLIDERSLGVQATVSGEVRRALDGLLAACRSHHSLLGPDALWACAALLNPPSGALARWLARLPPLVIEDAIQPTPAASAALIGLLRALQSLERPAAVLLAAGHDLGPTGLPAFFGIGELQPDQRALHASRPWRKAVFDAFVATGDTPMMLALDAGPVPLEVTGGPCESPDLADDLHARTPLTAPIPPTLKLLVLPTLEDEVEHAVRGVCALLEQGVPAPRIHVAVADPDRYRPVLDDLFGRAGLRVDRTDGTPLVLTPVGRAVALMLEAPAGTLSPLDWLALADLVERPSLGLREVLAPAGIDRGGPASWRKRLKHAGLEVPDALEPLVAFAETLTGPTTVAGWLELTWTSGLDRLAERSDESRRCWGAVTRAADGLAADLARVGRDLSPADLREHLVERLHATRVYAPIQGAVVVTGLLELRGMAPQHTFLLGVTRDRWPAPPSPSPFTSSRFSTVDRLAEARATFSSLLRNLTPDGSLTVSWPALLGGRETAPSPVIEELLGRQDAEGRSFAQRHLVQVHPPAPTQVMLDEQAQPLRGQLVSRPQIRNPLAVTAAEVAMQCAARFWYTHTLALRPPDPWDPELEPRRRGSALHLIFERFYQDRAYVAVPISGRSAARQALHAIATQVFDEVEAEGGFDPVLQAWARGRWLAGLLDARPLGLLGAWLEGEISRQKAPTAVEPRVTLEVGPFTLIGKVDRVERNGETVVVIDYKTGQAPTRPKLENALSLQPLVYLAALGGVGAAAFQVVAKPDQIRFAGWYGDASAMPDGARGVERDPAARRQQLREVAEVLQRVQQGNVATTIWGEDLGGCTYCAFRRVCRVQHDREPPC